MKNNNIIVIRKEDNVLADEAFKFLMSKTEVLLNNQAQESASLFKGISTSELEEKSKIAIQKSCDGTPFRSNEIKLISGQSFPDIIAETYYGIEVKSTIKNSWVSTGSSIVESTRNVNVENIYMLFAKLGGEKPEFKCRPYQDVLYDITVTHSPRYLINMELLDGNSIFDKIGMSYDELRTSKDSIRKVRHYYRDQAKQKGKEEMPWWLSDEKNEEHSVGMTLCLWSSITSEEKNSLTAQIFILFPEVIESNFNNAALWLCAAKGVLNTHMRDAFTAGGRLTRLNDEPLGYNLPRIYKNILECAPYIKYYLNDSVDMLPYITEFNPSLLNGNMYCNWLDQVEFLFLKKYNIPIKKWFEYEFRLS